MLFRSTCRHLFYYGGLGLGFGFGLGLGWVQAGMTWVINLDGFNPANDLNFDLLGVTQLDHGRVSVNTY